MQIVVRNSDNLTDKDIDRVVVRVKAILMNSKDEILFVFQNGIYQYIGGHIEEDEDLIEGLKREILEESGIEIVEEIKQFHKLVHYVKDYPEENTNSRYDYNYYIIKTDREPNLDNMNLTEQEKINKLEIRKIHINDVEKVLRDSILEYPHSEDIVLDTLEALEYYKKTNL